MEKVLVRYKVKPGKADENIKLVKEVYRELHALNPSNFRYATFLLEDGVTFVHLALSSGTGKNPLQALTAFRNFQSGIKERCEELPLVQHVEEVGSYRLTDHTNFHEA